MNKDYRVMPGPTPNFTDKWVVSDGVGEFARYLHWDGTWHKTTMGAGNQYRGYFDSEEEARKTLERATAR